MLTGPTSDAKAATAERTCPVEEVVTEPPDSLRRPPQTEEEVKDEEGEEPDRSATHCRLLPLRLLPLNVTRMESPGEKAPVEPQGIKVVGEDAFANLIVRAVLLTAGVDIIIVPATKGREQAL
jgi:hypothetical protein